MHWADLPEFHQRYKDELVAAGVHYVPYGYYGAAHRIASLLDPEGGRRRFAQDQHPDYLLAPDAAAKASPDYERPRRPRAGVPPDPGGVDLEPGRRSEPRWATPGERASEVGWTPFSRSAHNDGMRGSGRSLRRYRVGFIALLATRMRLQEIHRDAHETFSNGEADER